MARCSYHILVQYHFFLHIQAYSAYSGESETRQPFANVSTSPSILNLDYYPCTFSLHGISVAKSFPYCKELQWHVGYVCSSGIYNP